MTSYPQTAQQQPAEAYNLSLNAGAQGYLSRMLFEPARDSYTVLYIFPLKTSKVKSFLVQMRKR